MASEAEQEWLNDRLEGIDVEDFCQDFSPSALRIYLTSDLIMPARFVDYSLVCKPTHNEMFMLSYDESERLKKSEAILVICNYTDSRQLALLADITNEINTLSYEAPPIFLIVHTHLRKSSPEADDQLEACVRSCLLQEIDGIVSDELSGFTLVLEVRAVMQKAQRLSRYISHVVTNQHAASQKAESLQTCIQGIIWEYLRLRLAPNTVPPCDESLVNMDRSHDLSPFEFGRKLGEGMSGSVFQLLQDGKPSGQVVKMQPKSDIKDFTDFKILRRSLDISMTLSTGKMAHSSIVKLFQVFHSPTHILLLMEDAGPENLYHRLAQRCKEGPGCRPLPADKAISVISQALSVVHYMHDSCCIIHRDLKPENFIVHDDGNEIALRVADFDMAMSTKRGSLCMSQGGTIPFVAPEVMLEKSYDGLLADVWSMGMVLIEVLIELRFVEETFNLKSVVPQNREQHNGAVVSVIKHRLQTPGVVLKYLREKCRRELRPLLPVCGPLLDGMLRTTTCERWASAQCFAKSQEL